MSEDRGLIANFSHRAFEPELMARVDRFLGALRHAADLGYPKVGPFHFLLNLADTDGETSKHLTEFGIARGQLADLARANFSEDSDEVPLSLELEYLSTLAIAMMDELNTVAADSEREGSLLDESDVLAAALGHLEPEIADWLCTYGGIDIQAWIERVTAPPPEPLVVFGADGMFRREVLSPATFRLLEAAARQAAGSGDSHLRVPTLLLTLASQPASPLVLAAAFLAVQPPTLLRRLGGLSSGSTGHSATMNIGVETIAPELRTALEHAGALAADRGLNALTQAELLIAIARDDTTPGSILLRGAGLDPRAICAFCDDYYSESAIEDEANDDWSFDDALTFIRSRVVGQPAVLAALTPFIEETFLARSLQLERPGRPRGVFLFAGPSGSGKTMSARALARAVFGNDKALLFMEMGQFNDRVSMNRFMGAAPGYVGYGEGVLTNGLRDNPERVFLFDEVEKAHPEVFDGLIRLIDEAEITDPAGWTRDASKSVFVFTTNAGAAEMERLGGALAPDVLRARLLDHLRPEFINRIEYLLQFEAFDHDARVELAHLALERLREDVGGPLKVELCWGEDLPKRIAIIAAQERAEMAARGVNLLTTRFELPLLRAVAEARERGLSPKQFELSVTEGSSDNQFKVQPR